MSSCRLISVVTERSSVGGRRSSTAPLPVKSICPVLHKATVFAILKCTTAEPRGRGGSGSCRWKFMDLQLFPIIWIHRDKCWLYPKNQCHWSYLGNIYLAIIWIHGEKCQLYPNNACHWSFDHTLGTSSISNSDIIYRNITLIPSSSCTLQNNLF